jgi:peptidoglycan/LPS O-acetylase OafA/YrhL
MQSAEDDHKRLIALIVHIFALTIVAIAFLAGIYVLVATDSKTGLPDKAIAMVAGIALALASYVAGSKSK